MVAHGARSLLVKLLDMKMWDGSLVKYYISILVCPAAGIFCEILISHSLRIFWINRILLHGGKPWPKKELEFVSRWGKLESSLFLLLPTSRLQYHHRLHCLLRQFSTRRAVNNTIIAYIVCCGNFQPFQVNIVVVLSPHHSRIILVALVGCIDLLWLVDHARLLSFVLFWTMTTINFGHLMRRV